MNIKAKIMDKQQLSSSLSRIAHEIVENNSNTDDLILVGIRKRGVPIANMIAMRIEKIIEKSIPVAILDISSFRDDLFNEDVKTPRLKKGVIPFDVNGKIVVLVDDVIFTGRTIRAAIEAIFSIGRPSKIQLAALIDRGHRELPIRADYVGKNVPTSSNEIISVNIEEVDREENVLLYDLNSNS